MPEPIVSPKDLDLFFQQLDQAEFFKYVKEKEEIASWKKLQAKHLSNYGWLVFPPRAWIIEEKTGEQYADWQEPFEYYFLPINADDMFSGSLKSYFEQAAKLFAVRNLQLTIGAEDLIWGEKNDSNNYHYFKHTISINDADIIFAEGNLNEMGPMTYISKFMELLKVALEKQGANQEIKMITQEDGIHFLIAEKAIITIFKNLPSGVQNRIIEEGG